MAKKKDSDKKTKKRRGGRPDLDDLQALFYHRPEDYREYGAHYAFSPEGDDGPVVVTPANRFSWESWGENKRSVQKFLGPEYAGRKFLLASPEDGNLFQARSGGIPERVLAATLGRVLGHLDPQGPWSVGAEFYKGYGKDREREIRKAIQRLRDVVGDAKVSRETLIRLGGPNILGNLLRTLQHREMSIPARVASLPLSAASDLWHTLLRRAGYNPYAKEVHLPYPSLGSLVTLLSEAAAHQERLPGARSAFLEAIRAPFASTSENMRDRIRDTATWMAYQLGKPIAKAGDIDKALQIYESQVQATGGRSGEPGGVGRMPMALLPLMPYVYPVRLLFRHKHSLQRQFRDIEKLHPLLAANYPELLRKEDLDRVSSKFSPPTTTWRGKRYLFDDVTSAPFWRDWATPPDLREAVWMDVARKSPKPVATHIPLSVDELRALLSGYVPPAVQAAEENDAAKTKKAAAASPLARFLANRVARSAV